MKAGRELDVLVAEKVMGWTRDTAYCAYSRREAIIWRNPAGEDVACADCPPIRQVPRYSTDFAAAWLVVAKLHSQRYDVAITNWTDDEKLVWEVTVEYESVESEDVPLAICLAALAALQRDALSSPQQTPPQPHPSGDGGSSPSPLALLEVLYNCAVNDAKVEPELERQIRQAIGADSATEPSVVGHPPDGIPPHCPITGLLFFCMEKLDGKHVPTYGGPFESYTIPTICLDSDSGYEWRHFDHDAGDWTEAWENVPQSLIKGVGAPTTKKE